MIGQNKNIELIKKWRLNRSFPRFIIIEGESGSGRLTLAKEIIKQLNATGIISDISKDSVRDIIEQANQNSSRIVYLFEDCDDMSIQAKNSLLKVVEECPNNAYFIMTIQHRENMLDTILSRGTLIKIEPYTDEQLREFTNSDLVMQLFRNPESCKLYSEDDCNEAIKLAENIYNAIQSKSGVKLLSYCQNISEKDNGDKLDADIVLKAFIFRFKRVLSVQQYIYILKAKNLLKRKSINSKSVIESTLIKVMKEV